MRAPRLWKQTLNAALSGSLIVACGSSAEPGQGPRAHSSGGVAQHAAGAPAAGRGSSAGSSGTGGSAMTGGNAGGGGAGSLGGSTATAGRAGATGESGGFASGGRGGQAGGAGGAGGAGAAGGATGGQAGLGGQAGVGGREGASGSGPAGGSGACAELVGTERSISFGTLLRAEAVTCEARKLAASLADPSAPEWRASGDQHRKYRFADAGADEPYRLYVPADWDGSAELPLAMFLHGSGSNENTYVEQNAGQMLKLAEEHGYLLVSPLGDRGAYGNFLRLSAPFGEPEEAAKLMAAVTTESERTNELSERDVINVLELVLAEYPIDRSALFLFGHSMGSGGTWYLGGKYASYWRGLAPMSGPFTQETGYPWDDVRETFLLVTEGTQTPSLDGSKALRDWLSANGFKAEYVEVNADHGGMVPLVLPDVFDFFDRARVASSVR